jgi:DNA recombination protein RmuC
MGTMAGLWILIGVALGVGAMWVVVRRAESRRREADERQRETFAALSAEALHRNNEQFLALAGSELARARTEAASDLAAREQAVAQMVGPLRESLTKVDERLQQLDRERSATQAALTEQLRQLATANDGLRGQTGALVAALRQPQTRGRWGEMQLRRVVEMAGMLNHCDFVEQGVVAGQEGTLRPDLVVNLPGGKQVVVDAKAPLTAALDAYEAQDPAQRTAHLANHARLIREHVRKLSAKSYWSQFESAPDFVFLFLPGENFYSAALEADPSLLEECAAQSVLIATPTSLIALLRAVAYGWQQEKVAEGAREVSALGADLYRRISTTLGHVQKLGRQLGSAVSSYNDAVGSLETRVLPAARRFADHGVVSESTELPSTPPVELNPRVVQAPELSLLSELEPPADAA